MNIEEIVAEKLCDKETKLVLKKGTSVEFTPNGDTKLKYKKLEEDTDVRITNVYNSGDSYSFVLTLEFYINDERHLTMISDDTELNLI